MLSIAIRDLAIFVGALAVTPLAAEQPGDEPLPDLAPLTGREIYAILTKDEGRWMRQPCDFGVPVVTALEAKAAQPAPLRRLRLLTEALCADKEKRFSDGLRLAREVAALTPEDPEINLSLYFARRLEDPDQVLAILRGLEGEVLGTLARDEYWAAGRMLAAQGRDDEHDALALGWAEEGQLAFINSELHSGIALRALRAAARAARTDLAEQLLVPITSPMSYISLLTLREYAPFWPQIEQRAGPNLATIGAEHVTATRIRLTNASDDRDRFSEAAHALYYNGQFAEAIALAQRWRERAERGVGIEEGDGWALNIEAYSHDALGQPAKADAVFDELAVLDPAVHPWVVNFVINRASRLVGQGRWREGLAAAGLARTVAENYGSTYAKAIIARDHACTLRKMGRSDEAASELAFLRENWKEGIALSVQGLMCQGLESEAVALLFEGLRDKTMQERALAAFQTDELDLFYTPSTLPNARDLLAGHPALAEELAQHLRPMPEAFIPQAALKRVKPKLPAWE